MAARSIRIRLSDIREEIAGIRDLTKEANADFRGELGDEAGVQHALLIIAEAAKHLPPSLKEMRPRSAMGENPRAR